MTGTIDARLAEKEIILPSASVPAANYVPAVRTGNLLFISGQIPIQDGKVSHTGKVGDEHSIEDGYAAARLCGLNIIAQAKLALGDLDKVVRVVKLVGFVNAIPTFADSPKVINGASDLMVEVFGGDKGSHARSAVAVASLPLSVSVEVEAILEVS
jgi:enamine deaminase RidA (YjgF/YER057c/UK114 family)